MKKDKNKGKKWLIYILLGGFLVKLIRLIFNNEDKISQFAAEEEREITELKTRKESFYRFCRDSGVLFKHYFIPHEGNGHKPKILHPKSLISIILVLFILKIVVVGSLFLSYPEGGRMSEAMVSRILALTNKDRQAAGIAALSINPILSASALAKADDMVIRNYFSHYTPDGKKPWDFIDRNQYHYIYVGENLAMNFSTADSAHRALMASPSHKKNIMNERYRDIGLAMVSGMIDGKETNVLVEMFGSKQAVLAAKPAVASAEPAAVNKETKSEPVEVAGEEKEIIESPVSELPPPPTEPKVIPKTEQFSAQTEEVKTNKEELPRQSEEKPQYEQEKLALADLDTAAPITAVTRIKDTGNKNLVVLSKVLKTVNMTFALVMIMMVIVLLVNIFVRVEIQHKPVIIQTLLVILFIGSLWYFKLHYLETGLSDILILSF